MPLPLTPQRYSPDLDLPGPEEARTAADIVRTLLEISQKTYADGGHALRSVHAKSHGLLQAEVEVLGGLPPALAQGIFARPGKYPAVMRFSTIPGDILSDSVSTPRGVALKIVGVEGERLEGSEGATTQDFITVNGPQFNAPNAKAFLSSLKLLAATTDRAPGAKKVASAILRNVEKVIEAFGSESAAAKSLGGEPPNHILGETFFAQLPLRYGDYIAKIQIAPVAPELLALTDAPLELGDSPDVIREAVIDYFRTHSAVWELRVQLCADLESMPIDAPKKVWDESVSSFIPVARITALPQLAWSAARSAAIDDGMGFSPWHAVQAHRPLGELMRMRKTAYDRSQQFRTERNRTPVREPATLDDLPQ